jgi:carbonic anhydrase
VRRSFPDTVVSDEDPGIVCDVERDQMLRSAQTHAQSFDHEELTPSPTRHVVVLTCMDARLDLFRLLGLEIGDSHIIRNAGGRATDDALRSLILSTNSLGTREVAVIHHTGCGLHNVTDAQIADQVEGNTGQRPTLAFHPFTDLLTSVSEDVEKVRQCTYLPANTVVWGAYYDVSNGSLTPVGTVVPVINAPIAAHVGQ